MDAGRVNQQSRSRSRRRRVTDAGQTGYVGDSEVNENTPAAELERLRAQQALNSRGNGHFGDINHLTPAIVFSSPPDEDPTEDQNSKQLDRNSETATASTVPLPPTPGERPSIGTRQAIPFKLGRHPDGISSLGTNASTLTLTSQTGVISPIGDDNGKQLGHDHDHKHNYKPGKPHSLQDHGINSREKKKSNEQQNEPMIEPVDEAHDDQDVDDRFDPYDLRNPSHLLPDTKNSAGEQRTGMSDDNTIHGLRLVGGGLGRNGNGNGDEKEKEKETMRPGVDRSDTASLD